MYWNVLGSRPYIYISVGDCQLVKTLFSFPYLQVTSSSSFGLSCTALSIFLVNFAANNV